MSSGDSAFNIDTWLQQEVAEIGKPFHILSSITVFKVFLMHLTRRSQLIFTPRITLQLFGTSSNIPKTLRFQTVWTIDSELPYPFRIQLTFRLWIRRMTRYICAEIHSVWCPKRLVASWMSSWTSGVRCESYCDIRRSVTLHRDTPILVWD